MVLVYVDANVLVPSYARTLLVMGAPRSDFTVVWSRHAEKEAERHQEHGASRISDLRERFGWSALVPDGLIDLEDTDAKDMPILSAASLAGAKFIVTENVKDFGQQDLSRLEMSAVHPDLFLAHRLRVEVYRDTLTRLAKTRSKPPNTAEIVHRLESGARLPLLAESMRDAYSTGTEAPLKGAPRLTFRGVRCVVCSSVVPDPAHMKDGLGPECRR